MTRLTVSDAKARVLVEVARPDQKAYVGTLIHWPIPANRRRNPNRRGQAGRKAKVQLTSGAVLSVAPELVRRAPVRDGGSDETHAGDTDRPSA